MNPAQQDLVRTTFARLALMPEVAGALFYERLFDRSTKPDDLGAWVERLDEKECARMRETSSCTRRWSP